MSGAETKKYSCTLWPSSHCAVGHTDEAAGSFTQLLFPALFCDSCVSVLAPCSLDSLLTMWSRGAAWGSHCCYLTIGTAPTWKCSVWFQGSGSEVELLWFQWSEAVWEGARGGWEAGTGGAGTSRTHDCLNERSPRCTPNNHTTNTHLMCVCTWRKLGSFSL